MPPPLKMLSNRTADSLDKGHAHSRMTVSLLHIAIFLAFNIAVANGLTLNRFISPQWLEMLGPPPSPATISNLLMLYAFSAILLILCRILSESTKGSGLQHLFILFGFYLFYDVSGLLPSNFTAVLVAGMTILILNTYRCWFFEFKNKKE